jgi:hypothetical protein
MPLASPLSLVNGEVWLTALPGAGEAFKHVLCIISLSTSIEYSVQKRMGRWPMAADRILHLYYKK